MKLMAVQNQQAAPKPKTSRRSMPREVRREQLIQATARSIARSGLSGTTMAEVTREAGLSLGIANLHFESKDKLLLETLRYIAEEYNRGYAAIMESTGYRNNVDKLEAIIDFDFSRKVTQKEKLAVWLAFWGEARSRPTYQKICSRSDSMAEKALEELLHSIVEQGTSVDAGLLAAGYAALVDGLWLDLMICPGQMTRKKARKIARRYLASALPGYLDPGED